jgi:hypothetical protein
LLAMLRDEERPGCWRSQRAERSEAPSGRRPGRDSDIWLQRSLV